MRVLIRVAITLPVAMIAFVAIVTLLILEAKRTEEADLRPPTQCA
jgi:protein-S-isoprenylcysteine O-methyltransferase Ste14